MRSFVPPRASRFGTVNIVEYCAVDEAGTRTTKALSENKALEKERDCSSTNHHALTIIWPF